MPLQSVSANINYYKRVEATTNYLPAKCIRGNMGPFLFPIHNCKKSPISHKNNCVKSLMPQAINYNGNKSNTISAFYLQSKINNLPSPIIAHQTNANEFSTFEMIVGGAPPNDNQLLI